MIKPEANEIDYTHTYEEFTVTKPIWNTIISSEYQTLAHTALEATFNKFPEAEHIPLLAELFSKILVLSAEKSSQCSKPKKILNPRNKPRISERQALAFSRQENVCGEWRKQGRPLDPTYPARRAKQESHAYPQRIIREDEALKALEHPKN